jgi:radical SAM-linked protein
MAEQVFRLRISYAKAGRLAFLSHLELARSMERLIRRSGLPYTITQGFSAHMRFAPGPALPVGTEGLNELFDVWLSRYIEASDALAALSGVAPQGLHINQVKYVDPRAKGLAATHVIEDYALEVRMPDALQEVFDERISGLLGAGVLTVERKGKPKTYDLRSAIVTRPEITAVSAELGLYMVHFCLRSGQQGSIRPEILLKNALQNSSDLAILSIRRLALSEEDS